VVSHLPAIEPDLHALIDVPELDIAVLMRAERGRLLGDYGLPLALDAGRAHGLADLDLRASRANSRAELMAAGIEEHPDALPVLLRPEPAAQANIRDQEALGLLRV